MSKYRIEEEHSQPSGVARMDNYKNSLKKKNSISLMHIFQIRSKVTCLLLKLLQKLIPVNPAQSLYVELPVMV